MHNVVYSGPNRGSTIPDDALLRARRAGDVDPSSLNDNTDPNHPTSDEAAPDYDTESDIHQREPLLLCRFCNDDSPRKGRLVNPCDCDSSAHLDCLAQDMKRMGHTTCTGCFYSYPNCQVVERNYDLIWKLTLYWILLVCTLVLRSVAFSYLLTNVVEMWQLNEGSKTVDVNWFVWFSCYLGFIGVTTWCVYLVGRSMYVKWIQEGPYKVTIFVVAKPGVGYDPPTSVIKL